jgi:hypothetical protein
MHQSRILLKVIDLSSLFMFSVFIAIPVDSVSATEKTKDPEGSSRPATPLTPASTRPPREGETASQKDEPTPTENDSTVTRVKGVFA